MTTRPGFSSRSSETQITQLPHRDEAAAMSTQEPEAGWSNSDPVKDAPQDVPVDVEPPEELTPGFSNGKAVKGDSAQAESKVVDQESTEDKSVAPKKTAAKKTAKKG